ncbi:MAG: hypothetical protein JWO03_3695 [Bacteroidetes bacterium]|nr:hypothetical protein [Bacteroidota bacterium]
MNTTVELVNQWAAFEKKYPNGSIEDFCRYQLISKREGVVKGKLVGGVVPTNTPGLMFKIIGRIARIHEMYSGIALEKTGVNQIEEFGILLTIDLYKNPRKTEVIYDNLQELSSGTDMVNRLIKRGLVTEHADSEDKRAKRLRLTAAGINAISKAKAGVVSVVEMMTTEMDAEDQLLCIRLLKGLEIKFSERWPKDKGKKFDELYRELTTKDVVANKNK